MDAQTVAKLDVALGLNVGVVYDISKAQFVFPLNKSDNAGGGSFDIVDTPLKLLVLPAANASRTIEAHLIPRLNLGISALGDTLTANVFPELDVNAVFVLELDGETNITVDNGSTNGMVMATTMSVSGYELVPLCLLRPVLPWSTAHRLRCTARRAHLSPPLKMHRHPPPLAQGVLLSMSRRLIPSYIQNAARYRRRQGQPTPVVDAARLARSVSASESSEVGTKVLSSVAAGGSSASADISSLGGCPPHQCRTRHECWR